jgi:hypothetical protein
MCCLKSLNGVKKNVEGIGVPKIEERKGFLGFFVQEIALHQETNGIMGDEALPPCGKLRG